MKAVLEHLREEHQNIKKMVEVTRQVCERLNQAQEVKPEHIDEIVGFFQVFMGQCHEKKEDEVLFPTLDPKSVANEGGAIGVMVADHVLLRTLLKKMEENHSKFKVGEHKGQSGFVGFALNYVELWTQHIDKEERLFHKLLDEGLSEEREKTLLQKFEVINSQEIGWDRLKKLHDILDELSAIYMEK